MNTPDIIHLIELRKLLVGRIVVKIEEAQADEGVVLHFDDGSTFDVGYGSNEGSMIHTDHEGIEHKVFVSAYFTE